jgi:hypothetical protein
MNRQLYGVGNLVQREKFGIGSKLKKFVRNIIPNEVSEIAVKAAPFVAPFNPLLAGAMSAVGSFDQTGRIGSSIKSGLINYGLGQAARFAGGAGFQEGINPFAGYSSAGSFGGIGSLFTSPIGTQTGLQLGQYDFFKPYSSSPSGSLKTPTQIYADPEFADIGLERGIDAAPTGAIEEVSGAERIYFPEKQIADATKASTQGPGYTDLAKKVIDPQATFSERMNAVTELGGKALKDVYTDKDGKLDKLALISTISGVSSYIEAKKLADDAGLDDTEFNEEVYQTSKVSPYKSTYETRLQPSSFGIRKLSATGGRIDYAQGSDPMDGVLSITLTPNQSRENFQVGGMKKDMSNNRVSQIIQLIRDAEAIGDTEKAEELRLDLFRETKKANGGQITGRNNYLLGSIVKAVGVAEPTSGAKPLGLVFNMNEGGGGIGNLIKRVLQQVQPQQPRSVSNAPVNDLYKYYMENTSDEEYKNKIMDAIKPRFNMAMGSEIPIKQNAAGVSELDMRAKGGFIPVGIKEKADDVPAMLSKNEFVFTADAVRGAGKGSINKGAQKMYKLMKSLEKKVNKQR